MRIVILKKFLSGFLAVIIFTSGVAEIANAKSYKSPFPKSVLSFKSPATKSSTSKINLKKPEAPTANIASKPTPNVAASPQQPRHNTYGYKPAEPKSTSILPALAVGAVVGAVATSALSDEAKPSSENVQGDIVQSDVAKNSLMSDELYLTICDKDQLLKAQQWQESCKKDDQVSGNICPLLSYFRYCDAANAEEVKGLGKVKERYHNIYFKN